MQQPALAAGANLLVSSQDTSGSTITGYWTAVSQNGATAQTGFTPASFTLTPGTYAVTVSDYGTHTFSHWQHGNTVRPRGAGIGFAYTAWYQYVPLN